MSARQEHRKRLFFQRLMNAPACASSVEALSVLTAILNDIADIFTSIPNNPDLWESDMRLYPPQEDSRRAVPGRPDIVRYRSRRHSTWIAANGAIRITKGDEICLEKPGADGRTVTGLMADIVWNG